MPPKAEPARDAAAAGSDAAPKGSGALEFEGLVFAWCIWLLGSWAVALGPKWLSLIPSVRYMGVAAVVGSMLLWPSLRLSQEFGDAPGRWGLPSALSLLRVMLDWAGLNLVWVGVAITLVVMRQWHWGQAAVGCATLAAWTMLVGMVIVWGKRGAGPRVLANLVCMALVFGPPAAAYFLSEARGLEGPIASNGPLAMLWSSADVSGYDMDAGNPPMALLVAAGTALAITLVAVVMGCVGGYAGPMRHEP